MERNSVWYITSHSEVSKIEKKSIEQKIESKFKDGVIAKTSDEAKEIISNEINVPVTKLGIQYGIHTPLK